MRIAYFQNTDAVLSSYSLWQRLEPHWMLLQSLLTLQACPFPHERHIRPPQSMSVSSWFTTPSLQVGTRPNTTLQVTFHTTINEPWQMLDVHTLLIQSSAVLQTFIWSHFGQMRPPQSTSVSSWFFLLSVHDTEAKVRDCLLFEIQKQFILTNTYVVVADTTKAITVHITSFHIFTFSTLATTTINIRFILIFLVIRTSGT